MLIIKCPQVHFCEEFLFMSLLVCAANLSRHNEGDFFVDWNNSVIRKLCKWAVNVLKTNKEPEPLCVIICLQWEGTKGGGGRDKGEEDADRWREGILSFPLRFIFSKTHWGPVTRLSPASRNTALPCISFSLHSPSVAPFLYDARTAKL